jgi:glycerol uptake facilitator-like aquaporin
VQTLKGEQAAAGQEDLARKEELAGKAALIASVGGQRGYADWTNPDHRLRRLLSEFIGMAGLTFVLSGGAAILARYGGHGLQPWQTVLLLSAVSALWLLVAVYFLGDISAHFNPATTLAFALRRDMHWVMAVAYWVVQFAAAVCGSLLARGFFGPAGHLAATIPKPGQSWQAAGFETIITFGLVLMILNMANRPKLNGPFVPLAVGAYIMAWGTMGGPFEGASMNPARSFGPDLAIANLSTWWVYLIGPVAGAVIAVGVARVPNGKVSSCKRRECGRPGTATITDDSLPTCARYATGPPLNSTNWRPGPTTRATS